MVPEDWLGLTPSAFDEHDERSVDDFRTGILVADPQQPGRLRRVKRLMIATHARKLALRV